jgi:hypothetical protein
MSQKIESIIVSQVKIILLQSNIIKPYINENDKTPFWDGNLFIYKKPNKNYDLRNEDYLDKIPVQIKGISVNNLNKDCITFPISRQDLTVYMNDGGIIFFVGQIDKFNAIEIFFISLLPINIKKILEKHSTVPKINIQLRHFDKTYIKDFEDLCFDFIVNRKHQFGRTNISLSLSEVKELLIFSAYKNSTFEQHLLKNPVYFYGKKNKSDIIPIVIDSFTITKIEKRINREVSINGKKYFSDYVLNEFKGFQELIFDDNMIFHLEEGNTFIEYTLHENFAKRLNCTEFFKMIIEYEEFVISEEIFKFKSPFKSKSLLNKISNSLNFLEDIARLLDIFNIEYSKLNFNEISDEKLNTLSFAIDAMVYNKEIANFKQTPYKLNLNIGNLNLLTLIYKRTDGKIVIEDFAKLTYDIHIMAVINEKQIVYKVDPFVLLSLEEILNSSNIQINCIINKLDHYSLNQHYEEELVHFLLRVIKAYDKTNNEVYYETATNLCNWLLKHNTISHVHLINKYQLIKRKRDFNQNEKQEIKQLLEKSNKHNDYLLIGCCVYILLSDNVKFESIYGNLTVEQKQKFDDFPIFILYKNT